MKLKVNMPTGKKKILKKVAKSDAVKNVEKSIKNTEEALKESLPAGKQVLQQNSQFLIPLSIIVAGIFIAAAVYFSGGSSGTNNVAGTNQPGNTVDPADPGVPAEIVMRDVSKDDHIKGDFNAPVKIVEYSDMECPFCQKIHSTLQQIVDEYDGQVAWIYRHAPLEQLHPIKAQREAEASECAAELGGNTAFWAFTDRLFEITPSNNGLADSQLPEIAVYAGVNRTAFLKCLESGKYADKVQSDLEDSFSAGLQGTPYSVIIGPDGTKYPVSGAQPYEAFKATVDLALQAK